jgi:hypothetical protein
MAAPAHFRDHWPYARRKGICALLEGYDAKPAVNDMFTFFFGDP